MAILVWRKTVRLLHGVYPEPEILRYAQNDRKRRARNDKLGLSNNLREGTYAGTTAAELQDILRRAFVFEDTR